MSIQGEGVARRGAEAAEEIIRGTCKVLDIEVIDLADIFKKQKKY
jgi:hypothetical protein